MTSLPSGNEPHGAMAASASREGVRLTEPHREGCWGHEAGGFVCYAGVEWRSRTGGRRMAPFTGREWHRFKCNDPACPAIALVRIDVLADLVNGATDGE